MKVIFLHLMVNYDMVVQSAGHHVADKENPIHMYEGSYESFKH